MTLDAPVVKHGESSDRPMALMLPNEDQDVVHVVLPLPDGQALDVHNE